MDHFTDQGIKVHIRLRTQSYRYFQLLKHRRFKYAHDLVGFFVHQLKSDSDTKFVSTVHLGFAAFKAKVDDTAQSAMASSPACAYLFLLTLTFRYATASGNTTISIHHIMPQLGPCWDEIKSTFCL